MRPLLRQTCGMGSKGPETPALPSGGGVRGGPVTSIDQHLSATKNVEVRVPTEGPRTRKHLFRIILKSFTISTNLKSAVRQEPQSQG